VPLARGVAGPHPWPQPRGARRRFVRVWLAACL